MREFSNLFPDLAHQIADSKKTVIALKIPDSDFISLKFFLTKNDYYAVIVDDYPFKIADKGSLLEALYYQVRLITVHDLNWDAIQEGLGDAVKHFSEFKGVCLLFRNGQNLKSQLETEFKMLAEISSELNRASNGKRIIIFLNGD